ncbi:methyltransferase domain-containing protein [Acetobacterium paludosum]|uniref:tRNA 5-hydroxyuridine methyltransferase n=1 Tax=Acetobacterium paludosum TaxID=52693 RepID=A0A923HYM0_9FIRM|nr:O-methyltransferase [Acetobacterium paludosum]MBC3886978.1 methyltransferase domain-containing protein [Acetobacterium paludosum]
MSEIVQDYIEDYIRGLIPLGSPEIEDFRIRAENEEIPIIHKEVQKHIEMLIHANKIQSVLEVGTAVGYSSSIFALAMGPQGQVDTIERSLKMIVQADENISALGLKKQINILIGDAQEKVEELTKTYDMIFLDGAKGHYIHLLDHCLRCLKPGGMLVSDNVLFKGMIASDDLVVRRKITIVKRMRKYLEVISNHPQLITSVLPLGDGLAVSWKKDELDVNGENP